MDIEIQNNPGATQVETAAPPSDNSKGIMATARAVHGGALSAPAGPKDIVHVNGVSMMVMSAEAAGLVRKDSDGKYVDADAADINAALESFKDQGPEEDGDENLEHALAFDDALADNLTDLTQALHAADMNPAEVVGSLLSDPTALPEQVKLIAQERGISEADALTRVHAMAAGVEESIEDYILVSGTISAEQLPAFWTFVQERYAQELPGAASQAVFMGDARPFLQFAQAFASTHGSGRGTAEEVQKHARGYAGQGDVETVNVPGVGAVTLEAARRLGLA